MLPAEAQAAAITQIKPPCNAANTADATGAWVAVAASEGCLVFTQETGAIGSATLIGTLETSPAANGANNVAMTFDDGDAAFATVSAANNIQKKVVNARKNLGYIKYIGTVGTGPIFVGVSMLHRPKTTT